MNEDFSRWRKVEREGWGFSQEKRALYLFERKAIYVFKVGSAPFSPICLRKRRDEGWSFCRGDDLLDLPVIQVQVEQYKAQLHRLMTAPEPDQLTHTWRYDQLEQFFYHLDPAALAATLTIGTHTGCWPLYCTLARVKESAELLHTPALVVALSQAWRFLERRVCKEMRRIRRLATLPPRALVSELGFPGNPSTLRVLRKLTVDSLTPYHLLTLRKVMTTGGRPAKWLYHLAEINRTALLLLSHTKLKARYDWDLLEDVSRSKHAEEVNTLDPFDLLKDTVRMLRDRPMPRLTNLDRLTRLHDDLIAEARETGVSYVEFPAPPIPGIPGSIEPITNTHALFDEGRSQENCLAAAESWAEDICDGRYYVYRVLTPERASLGIRRRRDQWVVDQLYGAGNRPITAGQQDVQHWLDRYETNRWRTLYRPQIETSRPRENRAQLRLQF